MHLPDRDLALRVLDVLQANAVQQTALQGSNVRGILPTAPPLPRNTKSVQLHQLAQDGDVAIIENILGELQSSYAEKRLIEQPEPVHGLKALHLAARARQMDVVKLLMDRGADVNARGFSGSTPLHSAARSNIKEFSADTGANKYFSNATLSSTERNVAIAIDPIYESDTVQLALSKASSSSGGDSGRNVIAFLVANGADINAEDEYKLTPLHYAAMRNNVTAVQELLACQGIDLNARDRDSMTPLHTAAVFGARDLIDLLVRAGSQIDSVEEEGRSAIHLAAYRGQAHVVDGLLRWCKMRHDGFTQRVIMIKDNQGETSLNMAMASGKIEIVKQLLESGADPTVAGAERKTALHAAAATDKSELVELILSQKDIRVNALDKHRDAALHKTANSDTVNLLVQHGADIELRNLNGHTPLLVASMKGNADAVRCLLSLGAEVDAQDTSERSALYLAAERDQEETLRILLQYGANYRLSDRHLNSPLHVAAERGHLAAATLLFDAGANAVAKNEVERTALHLAAENDMIELVSAVLNNDSSVIDDEDDDANQPLHLAASAGSWKACEVLLQLGASITARNVNLWPPLHCAAAAGSAKTVELLLERGANVNSTDKAKITPLASACRQGHLAVVKLLLAEGADPAIIDELGRNALNHAIAAHQDSVARAILESKHWRNVLGNRRVVDGELRTPLRDMIQHMPDVVCHVFNRCTTSRGRRSDIDAYQLEFDYEFIEDGYMMKDGGVGGDADHPWDDETDALLPFAVPYSEKDIANPDKHMLTLLVQSDREDLAAHPLVLSLLRHKWRGTAQLVYYATLLLYAGFVITITMYALVTRPPYLALTEVAENNTLVPRGITCEEFLATRPPLSKWSEQLILYFFAPVNLLREALQFFKKGVGYFSMGNVLEIFVYVATLLLVLELPGHCFATDFQWILGGVGVCAAWLNLLLILNKFPMLGIYMVMLQDVGKTFLRASPILLLTCIAFMVFFKMMLGNIANFNGNSYQQLVKVLLMSLGDLGFDDTLNAPDSFLIPYEIVTKWSYMFLSILIGVLVMNLLVGLAVDDIKGVQEKAQLKKLAMQTELVLEVNASLPEWFRRKSIIRRSILYPNRMSLSTKLQSRLFSGVSVLSSAYIADRWTQEEDEVQQLKTITSNIAEELTVLEQCFRQMEEQRRDVMERLSGV